MQSKNTDNIGWLFSLLAAESDSRNKKIMLRLQQDKTLQFQGNHIGKTKEILEITERRSAYEPWRQAHISGYDSLMPKLRTFEEGQLLLTSLGNENELLQFYTDVTHLRLIGWLSIDLKMLRENKQNSMDSN